MRSDCNWTRTQNHLVLKRTLNHLAKLDIQATIECGFTLKRVRDMTRTYRVVQCALILISQSCNCFKLISNKFVAKKLVKELYWVSTLCLIVIVFDFMLFFVNTHHSVRDQLFSE